MILLTAAAGSALGRDTTALTTGSLVLIGVLIVLVVLAMIWGARQKRARAAAEESEAERAETLLEHPQTNTAVSPAPPPLGDAGVTATAPEAAKPDTLVAAAPAAPVPPADTPAVTATAPAGTHKLLDVKGLGPKAVPLLATQGVTTIADLAGLTAARAAEVDAGMGALAGRMARDRWVEQAQLLDAGQVAEFEQKFGKL